MVRMVGAVLLMAGCGAAGLGAVKRLDDRIRDLRELAGGLETLRRELSWQLAPLPKALETAARGTRGCSAQFFEFCAQGVRHLAGTPFHQLWMEGLKRCSLRLEQEDMVLLEQLGPVLGRYDADNQQQAIDGVLSRLKQQQAQAAENRQRLGRVYGVLGMTVGLFLVILFI